MKRVLRNQIRTIHCSSRALQDARYLYYDIVIQQKQLKEEFKKEAQKKAKEAQKKPKEFVFEGNSSGAEENARRLKDIFGGRLVGEKAGRASSRYFSNSSYNIAGVQVPMRPTEPDNCCMSGCVNCVWELFNEDLKEYQLQRKLAAEKLKEQGGVWPLKYDPPLKWLNKENLPFEIRNKSQDEVNKIIADQEFLEDNTNRWESVSMLAFANFEKNLKQKRAPTDQRTQHVQQQQQQQ